jgi:D-alanine-D-alanine ligase
MNKILSKQIFKHQGIKVPGWREFNSKDIKHGVMDVYSELFRSFILPAVVKPASGGSSIGVSIVEDYKTLPEALLKAAEYDDKVLVEEFIRGIETTCGVIEIRSNNKFFDYDAKYAGKSQEIVPAVSFNEKIKKEIEELARKVHKSLGLRHYSRTDMIVHPSRGIYVLETNTLPGLTEESLIPKSLRTVGSSLEEFTEHLIKLVQDSI